MMAYVRKTRDVWEVQGNYGQGWECVTAEDTWKEARERVREYRENEPQYPHQVKLVRERIKQISSFLKDVLTAEMYGYKGDKNMRDV
jgi:hypothetical protein